MEFDIRTLSVLQGMAWVVFALTTLVMARVHPKEAHLRDWALGAVLCMAGSALHTLGATTSPFVASIGGNVLLCVGGRFFFVALRRLLGQPRPRGVAQTEVGFVLEFAVTDTGIGVSEHQRAAFQTVFAGRQLHHARLRRQRPGPVHRASPGALDGWRRWRTKPAGSGRTFLVPSAGGRSQPIDSRAGALSEADHGAAT